MQGLTRIFKNHLTSLAVGARAACHLVDPFPVMLEIEEPRLGQWIIRRATFLRDDEGAPGFTGIQFDQPAILVIVGEKFVSAPT